MESGYLLIMSLSGHQDLRKGPLNVFAEACLTSTQEGVLYGCHTVEPGLALADFQKGVQMYTFRLVCDV